MNFNFPRHSHPHWEINLTLAGKCRVITDHGELTVTPGDLLFVRPGTGKTWRVPQETPEIEWQTAYSLFQPRPHWLPWLKYPETLPGIIHLPLDDHATLLQVRRGLEVMHRLFKRSGTGRDSWTLLELERVLLNIHLHYQMRDSHLDERVHKAVEFLEVHYAKPLSLAELARASHISRSQLALLFSKQMGMTPMQYLEIVRLGHASALLGYSPMSTREIAIATGFRNDQYFARRFRLLTGQTPKEFRKTSHEGK